MNVSNFRKVASGALDSTGRFQEKLKLRPMTGLVKGFGCRQAYESLSCRNLRSARVELWGFVFRGMPTVAANCLIMCAGRIDEAACWRGRRACRSDSSGVCLPNRWRHNSVHMRYRWPAPAWRGCACKWAIPGHEAVSRFVAAVSGGPRGCLHRSNILMIIMRPPQQGHDGRRSAGSSGAS